MLPYMVVIALIQLTLNVYSTYDLLNSRAERTSVNIVVWLVIIWLISTIGAIIYLLVGRIPVEKKADEGESWA